MPSQKPQPLTLHCNGESEDLVKKYAVPGPRYTSYPTADRFSAEFSTSEYLDWQAGETDNKRAPLSLYVHLPFCRDICYFCACNKVVTRKAGAAREYLDYMHQEIAQQAELVGKSRPITQMHWGGGTPTYLKNAEITELMHSLASHFSLMDKGYREYSIEIDPRTIDKDTVALLKGVGFNRISMGIQDFDPLVQQAVNRCISYKQVFDLVDTIRAHEFSSLSFDLIYGLPLQDEWTMKETLFKVLALKPDRISCYSYAHLPTRFKAQRAIDRQNLPSAETKLALAEQIRQTLSDEGYICIGMDHFVLPEDELATAQEQGRLQRNFQGYSLLMAQDTLGIGASAISQMGGYYLQNETALDKYYEKITTGVLPITKGLRLSNDDEIRRHIIMTLMSCLALDIEDCNTQFEIDFQQMFRKELGALQIMQKEGLVEITPARLRITPKGLPFLRNVCMHFDAYQPQAKNGPRSSPFSATV